MQEKKILEGSSKNGFIKDAVNELHTFYTPKKIVDIINRNLILGNPKFKIK